MLCIDSRNFRLMDTTELQDAY